MARRIASTNRLASKVLSRAGCLICIEADFQGIYTSRDSLPDSLKKPAPLAGELILPGLPVVFF